MGTTPYPPGAAGTPGGWRVDLASGAMGESARNLDCDLRAMLRLAGEAGELPAESDARRRHLLEGLCRVVGGHVAMAFVLGPNPPAGPIAAHGSPILVTGLPPAQEAALRHYLVRNPD